jgi:tetratricopeptide (TPR) repeat protein
MKSIRHPTLVVIFFAVFSFGFFWPARAADAPCDLWIAKAVSVQGTVEARKAGTSFWVIVKLNDTFCPGDMIRVQENSRAAVALSNETNLRLDQRTTIIFTGVENEQTFLLDILSGALNFFSRFTRRLKILTPFVNASVEGTEGFIRVEEEEAFVSIFEGTVLASNAAGTLTLTGGQSAVAKKGTAPVQRVVVRPRDAVHWALYYPPVMYFPPGVSPKEDLGDPRFLTYRASQLLAVGRVDDANSYIQRALSLDPRYSDAHALQAIIFVAQNERNKALNAARKAIETGPNSASARIANSYAQQAAFDLAGARTSIEEALKLDPDNALAWARLAELWSSFGRQGKALDAAQKAVELDPSLSRTQMVLGFAYLTQIKTTKSRAAFEKAIQLDQADPLSRLGLGLAKIRDGDLNAGGQEIEIAASLDPNNSIIRSYLGKTYFEKKQIGLDEREYTIAKELDPNDPTPWFYDAIAKQTTNRPVEALHNLQKAIDLNDNRAVFRSRLLLDEDLAARSAALARIYSDLGFQQRALFEGWMAVNTDPTNFSAHRFLADSYSNRPRHEIARVSELLQSQLLQPLNITPIQPRLAESSQFLIISSGPGTLSFREFNPIFNRNRIGAQGTGLGGEDETLGGEGIASGIYKGLSFSSGYTYFDTDGWRKNADQTDKIANVFAQYQISYKTSIQAEYRYRDIENGDLQKRFFEDDFLPNLEEDEKKHTIRLGLRHAFTPGSVLIGNFSYQDKDFVQRDIPGAVFGPFGPNVTLEKLNLDTDARSAELGYLFRSKYANLVSGAGYFDIDSDLKQTTETFFPFPPFPPPPFGPGGTSQTTVTPSDLDVEHTNLYLYAYLNFPKNVTWTLGASGDYLDSDSRERPDKDQFNPKFGITWSPFSGTTLRGAAFKALKRTLITDQTLEPTQVAGFNQFFDDANGTESKHYGAAIDQKITKTIFAGLEYYKRDLEVPFLRPGNTPGNVDWDEKVYRAYLNWAPHKWLSLSADYLYEEFDRDESLGEGTLSVETHYLPLGINFFHPSGLSTFLKATYVDQEGRFERLSNIGTFTNEQDDFWLLDAAISYRLPKRYGIITLGVTNLLDEKFEYFDTDRDNPRIQPERYIFGKVTLVLP